ncbi:MAG: hypothetical protein U1E97_10000 [Alphaproteobacteria bacterium]
MPTDVTRPLTGRDLDRRTFLAGGWLQGRKTAGGAKDAPAAAIVVQVFPAREADVERMIQALDTALGGIRITGRADVGRLRVSVRDGAMVGAALAQLASLPGVLTAAIDSGAVAEGAIS